MPGARGACLFLLQLLLPLHPPFQLKRLLGSRLYGPLLKIIIVYLVFCSQQLSCGQFRILFLPLSLALFGEVIPLLPEQN